MFCNNMRFVCMTDRKHLSMLDIILLDWSAWCVYPVCLHQVTLSPTSSDIFLYYHDKVISYRNEPINNWREGHNPQHLSLYHICQYLDITILFLSLFLALNFYFPFLNLYIMAHLYVLKLTADQPETQVSRCPPFCLWTQHPQPHNSLHDYLFRITQRKPRTRNVRSQSPQRKWEQKCFIRFRPPLHIRTRFLQCPWLIDEKVIQCTGLDI